MAKLTLYHNPRCSKSRQTLALLTERGLAPTIVRYLDDPPTAQELRGLLDRLALAPRDAMRRKESVYRELDLDRDSLGDDELIAAIVEHPILLERPILVRGSQAVIGRPPENVLALIEDLP